MVEASSTEHDLPETLEHLPINTPGIKCSAVGYAEDVNTDCVLSNKGSGAKPSEYNF